MPTVLSAEAVDSGLARSTVEVADLLLGLLGLADAELSLSLVGDAAIRELNRTWRSVDRSTDVLAFPLEAEPGPGTRAEPRLLGDVVISLDTAARQADGGGWSLAEEVNRLLLHGLLHLVGYDHEESRAEQLRMRSEETRLARELHARGIGCAAEDVAGEAS